MSKVYDLCRQAICECKMPLVNVPPALRKNRELCLLAVQNDGASITSVPEEILDMEIVLAAASSTFRSYSVLEHLPSEFLTREVCLAAVQHDIGSSSCFELSSVPKKLCTREMYLAAVRARGCALKFIPVEKRDRELCLSAVGSDGRALRWVPEEFLTENLCAIAVAQNGAALGYVPDELRSPELCRIAICSNGLALEYVPENLLSMELCRQAVENNGCAICYVPQFMQDVDLCHTALARTEEEKFYKSWYSIPMYIQYNKDFWQKILNDDVIIRKFPEIANEMPVNVQNAMHEAPPAQAEEDNVAAPA